MSLSAIFCITLFIIAVTSVRAAHGKCHSTVKNIMENATVVKPEFSEDQLIDELVTKLSNACKGSEINGEENGLTILMIASQQKSGGQKNVNKLLFEAILGLPGIDVDKPAVQNGYTALMHSVSTCGDTESVFNDHVTARLIVAGANVNVIADNGVTPLMVAVTKEGMHALIDKGAIINAADGYGKTVLMTVIENNRAEGVIEAVIETDVDVNMEDNDGKTALMYAIEKRNLPLMTALLDKGANYNAMNKNHETVLQIAIKVGNEYVEELIKRQVDVNAISDDGTTALWRAIPDTEKIAKPLVKMLIHAVNADLNLIFTKNDNRTVLTESVLRKDEEVFNELMGMEWRVDVNCVDGNNDTPLMKALGHADQNDMMVIAMVNALLNTGRIMIDYAHPTDNSTALMKVTQIGNIEYVRRIFRMYPDVAINAVDSKGMSALDIAIDGGERKHQRIAKFLIEMANALISEVQFKKVIQMGEPRDLVELVVANVPDGTLSMFNSTTWVGGEKYAEGIVKEMKVRVLRAEKMNREKAEQRQKIKAEFEKRKAAEVVIDIEMAERNQTGEIDVDDGGDATIAFVNAFVIIGAIAINLM